MVIGWWVNNWKQQLNMAIHSYALEKVDCILNTNRLEFRVSEVPRLFIDDFDCNWILRSALFNWTDLIIAENNLWCGYTKRKNFKSIRHSAKTHSHVYINRPPPNIAHCDHEWFNRLGLIICTLNHIECDACIFVCFPNKCLNKILKMMPMAIHCFSHRFYPIQYVEA